VAGCLKRLRVLHYTASIQFVSMPIHQSRYSDFWILLFATDANVLKIPSYGGPFEKLPLHGDK
jgi:hypothetical protein